MTARAYDWIAGVGGLGTGLTMRLVGDHTLGREESRAAQLLDDQDRCKLHIVFHTVARLLGPDFPVHPIGAVGDDDAGRIVLGELRATGMRLDRVRTHHDLPTLFAVAFGYPNGDGGNLTAIESASDAIAPEQVRFDAPGRGIVVALPEVPLATRAALLRQDPARLRVASYVTGELPEVLAGAALDDVDLLAVNADEARVIAADPGLEVAALAEATVDALRGRHPSLSLVMTSGAAGSWSWDGAELHHARVPAPEVVATAGAGDAHLGAILAALALGADVHEANRLGALVSALKVGGRHSINRGVDGDAVRALRRVTDIDVPRSILERLR